MKLKYAGALLFFVVFGISIPARADRPTNIAVAPASGTYGGLTSLQARLTYAFRGVPSRTISFVVNGANLGSATTNSSGIATLNVRLVGINASTYANGINAI